MFGAIVRGEGGKVVKLVTNAVQKAKANFTNAFETPRLSVKAAPITLPPPPFRHRRRALPATRLKGRRGVGPHGLVQLRGRSSKLLFVCACGLRRCVCAVWWLSLM